MRLKKWMLRKRLLAALFAMHALGGCVSDRQFSNFIATEFSRLVSETAALLFSTAIQGITGT